MADVTVSGLPDATTASLADTLVGNQSGTTKEFPVSAVGAAVAGIAPAQIAYSAAIPLTLASAHMAAHTVTGAITFNIASSPVDGAFCLLALTANGVHVPNFSAFTKAGPLTWINTTGVVNIIQFFRIAGVNYYQIIQAEGSGSVGDGYRYFRLNFTKIVDGGNIVPTAQATGAVRVCEFEIVAGGTDYPTANMTAADAPSPLVASAGSEVGGFEAWYAFDGVYNDLGRWISGTQAPPYWLKIDMGDEITPTAYRFGPDNGHGAGNWSISWTFEGSNTGAFAGEQTVLDTQTDYDGAILWNGMTVNTFTLS